MKLFDDGDGESFGIAFTDILFNFSFMVAAMLALSMLLPQLKSEEEQKIAGVAPGKMCIELTWPAGIDIDIDLWARGPDDAIVGYSNRSSEIMDLLRDDLGQHADPGDANVEMICTRALVKGGYTVNAHFYSDRMSGMRDIPVTMVVRFPSNTPASAPPPIKATGTLTEPGNEITLIDFFLDDKGKPIQESFNATFQALRSHKKVTR